MLNRSAWKVFILLALAIGSFGKRGFNLDKPIELSHFRGVIAPTDILCLKFYIGKKTTLPLQVPVLTNVSF